MSEDKYTKWLGLPAGPRPPQPHELLGLKPGVRDRAAIDRAVAKRMDRLDQYVLSGDPEVRDQVQRLMNEVARARTELVDALPAGPEHSPTAPPPTKPARPGRSAASAPSKPTRRPPVTPVDARQPEERADGPSPPESATALWVILGVGWVVSIILTAFITTMIVSGERSDSADEQALASRDADEPIDPASGDNEPGTEERTDPDPDPEVDLDPDPEVEPEVESEPELDSALQAFIQARDRLDPAGQVELMCQAFDEQNPGIESKMEFAVDDVGALSVLEVGIVYNPEVTPRISDLTPLTGLRLTRVSLVGLQGLDSLEPLRGMPLQYFRTYNCPQVTDLDPLAGMPLTDVCLWMTPVTELSPLAGMELVNLELAGTSVTDLSPLAGMEIETVYLSSSPVTELTPLRGMPIRRLSVRACKELKSLEGLEGMTIEGFNCSMSSGIEDFSALSQMEISGGLSLERTGFSDLTLLHGLEIRTLRLDGCRNLTSLAGIEHLPNLEAVFVRSMGIPRDEVERAFELERLRRQYPSIRFHTRAVGERPDPSRPG